MEEQKYLDQIIDEKINAINGIIDLKKRKIEQLKEYKESLIYEYVTGKKEADTWWRKKKKE